MHETSYAAGIQLVYRTRPAVSLFHNRLFSWCSLLCPHIETDEAVKVLLHGDAVACPSLHVHGVFHVLRIERGTLFEPVLELLAPQYMLHCDNLVAFMQEAVTYADTTWPEKLLRENEWTGIMELHLGIYGIIEEECRNALLLHNPLEHPVTGTMLDRAVSSTISADDPLYMPELIAAVHNHPTKQWISNVVCLRCRGMHFGACMKNHYVLRSEWIQRVTMSF